MKIDSDNCKIEYTVQSGEASQKGTVSRNGACCPCCGSSLDFQYIRAQGCAGKIGSKLIAVVAELKRRRLYLTPDLVQKKSANVEKPVDYPSGVLSGKCRVNVSLYGFDETSDLFTNRQLTALSTFSDLVKEAQKKVEQDAVIAGMKSDSVSLDDGGKGTLAYGQAVGVYLAFVVDKMTDYHSTICSWNPLRDGMRSTFGRQAIPMVWDYAEANPFSNSSGCFTNMLKGVTECLSKFNTNRLGYADQFDAQTDTGMRNIMISTDPPYYDNIGYADLSDYFYVWMRSILRDTYPALFRTMLVPKAEELVATPYRFGGSKDKACEFFEHGMLNACRQMHKYSREDIPVTIYYAYKQSETDESDDGEVAASTGWETMLSAIIKAGFSITGTWPMRTERGGRMIGIGANALASSIVLVCRKRKDDAPLCTRRNFINELKRELHPALEKLQSSNIAPVDLAQSAIGPGMGVYSKYSKVLEADGSEMSVRSALKIINQELDVYFNEQDGDLDSESRFCVDLYSQFSFDEMPFGDANTLATAKNTSVALMKSHGILYAQKSKVHLIEREDLPKTIKVHDDSIWLSCQQLTYFMGKDGVEGAAKAAAQMLSCTAEQAKDLAYRLYTIAEKKHWTQEAYAYNSLVVAWPEIQLKAAGLRVPEAVQTTLF